MYYSGLRHHHDSQPWQEFPWPCPDCWTEDRFFCLSNNEVYLVAAAYHAFQSQDGLLLRTGFSAPCHHHPQSLMPVIRQNKKTWSKSNLPLPCQYILKNTSDESKGIINQVDCLDVKWNSMLQPTLWYSHFVITETFFSDKMPIIFLWKSPVNMANGDIQNSNL